jgi:anti-sigma B factor antagonist
MSSPPPNRGGTPDRAWFRTEVVPECVIVTVGGEIDVHAAPDLDAALRLSQQRSTNLVVDMSLVTFIDSSGLGALIGARRRVGDSGGRVLLVQPPDLIRRVLASTQLQLGFPVYETVDDAVTAVRGS